MSQRNIVLKPGAATAAQCRICGQKFKGPEMGGPIIVGEKETTRIQRYVLKLTEHLQQKHPEQLGMFAQQSGDYLGLLCLMTFDTADEELAKERDFLRWQLHRATRRVFVTDERIAEKCKVLVDAAMMNGVLPQIEQAERVAVEDHIAGLLREMRNVFEERGRYPEPSAPPASPENGSRPPGS